MATLFGRETELARLEAWAHETAAAPLVVVGPGGIGKTTLLRAFMATHPEGRTIDCSHCSSVEEVAVAIAAALDLDASDRNRIARRARALGVTLLALDNLEQLASQTTELEPFFGLVPRTIATSRIALRIRGESVFLLAPLANDGADAPAGALVRWKSGIAAASDAERALLARIARLTDGIPLALELAATQVATFGLAWTAERLEKELLGDVPTSESARSLLATFHSSWTSLPDRERAAVARLSLFSGLFSLDEASALLEEDASEIVATLTRHSWLAVEPRATWDVAHAGAPEREPRFRMLVPLRAYARAALDASSDRDAARARHTSVVLAGPVRRFYPDLLELIAAAAETPANVARATELAARCALETGTFSSFGKVAETPAAEAKVAAAPRADKFRAWLERAKIDWRRGRLRECRARAESAMEIAESDHEIATCLLLVARTHGHSGEYETAYQVAIEAQQRCDDPKLAGEIAVTLIGAARWLGYDAEARTIAAEGVTSARAAGDVGMEARLLAVLASTSYDAGALEKAELAAREAIALVPEDSPSSMYAHSVLADILVAKQAWDEAEACFDHILRHVDENVMAHMSTVLAKAHLFFERGRIEDARALLETQSGKGEQLSIRATVDALYAAVCARLGAFSKAERAADTVYARPCDSVETAFARTLLLHYELERLRLDPRDDEARQRAEKTLRMLGEAGERRRRWASTSAEVRKALASVREALVAEGFRPPAERDESPELVFEQGGDEVRCGTLVLSIGQRANLRQILLGLVEAPRGTELSVEQVFALGWPGERVAQRAARNRVHVALATLRRELLGASLRRSRSGYSLDPALTIVRR